MLKGKDFFKKKATKKFFDSKNLKSDQVFKKFLNSKGLSGEWISNGNAITMKDPSGYEGRLPHKGKP